MLLLQPRMSNSDWKKHKTTCNLIQMQLKMFTAKENPQLDHAITDYVNQSRSRIDAAAKECVENKESNIRYTEYIRCALLKRQLYLRRPLLQRQSVQLTESEVPIIINAKAAG